jgi:hypothetical protein
VNNAYSLNGCATGDFDNNDIYEPKYEGNIIGINIKMNEKTIIIS